MGKRPSAPVGPLTSIKASPLLRGMLRLMEPVSGAKSCHSTPSLSSSRRHSSPAANRSAGCATMPTPSRSSWPLLVYALVTAVESLLAARLALFMVPDHAGGRMYGAVGGLSPD